MTSIHDARPWNLVLRVIWILSTAGLAVLIAAVTLREGVTVPSGLAMSDKLYHLAAFAALVLPTAILQPAWSLHVGLAVFFYGGVIELIQPSVGRDAEWLDVLANGLGVVAGLILGALLRRLARRLRWYAA